MSKFPLGILKTGVKLVDKFTPGVQTIITLEQWTGQSATGKKTYASPIIISAIVDRNTKIINLGGQLVTTSGEITILKKVRSSGVTTNPLRKEPIDPNDRITLSDGTIIKILSTPGSIENPETKQGLIIRIIMG
jgi:hypothetical protein